MLCARWIDASHGVLLSIIQKVGWLNNLKVDGQQTHCTFHSTDSRPPRFYLELANRRRLLVEQHVNLLKLLSAFNGCLGGNDVKLFPFFFSFGGTNRPQSIFRHCTNWCLSSHRRASMPQETCQSMCHPTRHQVRPKATLYDIQDWSWSLRSCSGYFQVYIAKPLAKCLIT